MGGRLVSPLLVAGYDQEELERLATNLRVEAALLSVLDLLHPLPLVVFKGPLLTHMIYGDLVERASADNDLWIEEPHATTALGRLMAAGYAPLPHLDPRAALGRVGQVALFPADPTEPSVDLHVEPFSKRFFNVDYAVVTRHICSASVQGYPLRTFDRPLAFCHLVAHYVQHHLEARLLDDLGAAYRRWRSARGFYADLRELSQATCTPAALALVLRMLDQGELGAESTQMDATLSKWDMLRVQWVQRRLGSGRPLRPIERQVLALFLVAPHRLFREAARAAWLDSDDLASRYGPGQREVLLLRHLWSKLSG